jgi:hypothetical protein
MRARIPIAVGLVALFLGSGTGLAAAGGPSVTEFETGLTDHVQLWGITSGPDGNSGSRRRTTTPWAGSRPPV